MQDILNRTRGKQPLPWYKTLKEYYYRPQWELYDVRVDPAETNNLHGMSGHEFEPRGPQGRSLYRGVWSVPIGEPSLKSVEAALRERLAAWQRRTLDPWLCAPGAVLERGECGSLHNGLHHYRPR